MRLSRLILREIGHRKLSFALGLVSVTVAIGSLVGSLTLLELHDRHTQTLLEHKEAQTEAHMAQLKDDMRKAMLKLGLNLLILPKDQNVGEWYADDTGTTYMDESDVDRLADSSVITVRHFLPCLQQKVKWPEQKRTIILVGSRGEVPNLHKSPRVPIVQPVPDGTVVLGHELHQSLGMNVGDTVTLMGEPFTVHRCHEERGNKDDITAWISLAKAQQLLGKEGKINAIMALQCLCKGNDIALVRSDITGVLPHTRVLELGTERRLARAEARLKVGQEAKAAVERERIARADLKAQRARFASILVAVVMISCAVWVGGLTFSNVRERQSEIGLFRAIGFRSHHILLLFLSRSIALGVLGGVVGFFVGLLAGGRIAAAVDTVSAETSSLLSLFDPVRFVVVLLLAVALCTVASWVPSVQAARQDPARILRRE